MMRFEYVTPKTVEEALKHLPEGRPKAGGTELLPMIQDRLIAPKRLVNLLGLDLRAIETGATLKVGALATLAEVAAHPKIRDGYAALAQAAGEAATPQVRNMGTVGGNLCQRPRCWYFRSDQFRCLRKGATTCPAMEGDNRYHAILGNTACAAVHPSNLAPALIVLGGTVHVVGPKGARAVPAARFFDVGDDVTRETTLEPGEIVTGIEAPPGAKSVYLELRERQSFDWPLVSVAAAKRDGTIHMALGGVAPRPVAVADMGPDEVLKTARPLKHNAYKVKLARVLMERAIESLGR
ncbi:MAG: FAD binding domain-containing protein [Planctomycetes bacterium]|nr:FAD binding domain-containing protein [Planctomycetota bacterium]